MKNSLRKIAFVTCLLAASAFPPVSHADTVVYRLTMTLGVPRVYDNMESLGYRKRQFQTITGYVYIDKSLEPGQTEPIIYACDLVNKTHKISKKCVTYDDAVAEGVMYRYIGSNKTGKFVKPNVEFSLDLDPSYNIGEDEPDNALIITLAGYGESEHYISGKVTGHIGCGCSVYGHVSPTRTIGGEVDDKVPLCGTFRMSRIGTYKFSLHCGL